MIKEKTLSLLIEGGLLALEDSVKKDPKNIMYPDEKTSGIYEHLRNLIAKAKQEHIDILMIEANYGIFLNKYKIAV